MLLSMTGFGNSNGHFEGKEIIIEIRCLNSKINDFRLKVPNSYRQKELDIRRVLNDDVVRGKLDVTISIDAEHSESEFSLNKSLFKSFYRQIREAAASESMDFSNADMLNAILKFPNVIESHDTLISDAEFAFTMDLLNEAVEKLNDFRSIEGGIIATDMAQRIRIILDYLHDIEKLDGERKDLLKDRLQKLIQANFHNDGIDMNRFEQELIYYLERLDITEEKVRLKQHCEYYLEELQKPGHIKSRKLNFISQEMGREINTLGAKAQFSPIQKIVVNMKDELEKIKEQMANVL